MQKYILALDQGTTSSRAILFDHNGEAVASDQREFEQILPHSGHVEHKVEDLWESQLGTAKGAIEKGGIQPEQIAAIGITNQRETTIVWDKQTGKPIHNAIVWQSRISSPICDRLKSEGHEQWIREKTGLVIDAYFSATKLKYLLDNVEGSRAKAKRGELLFGTVDCYMIWRLTEGKCHVTDVSNASRTMMMDLHSRQWDDELLELLGIPHAMLPEIVPSSGIVGETAPSIFGRSIPIAGIAGDQQAATFGQTCFDIGSAKNTYGTGAFALMNIGSTPVLSENNLLTTVAWQVGDEVTYCLEGSVFIAGAVVQWLRDGLGIIGTSSEIEELAMSVPDNGGVFFVPALVGLGAPYWDSNARGTILGISRGTNRGHIARAAVESMAFQTCDLVDAMQRDSGVGLTALQVDGGASINDSLMQFQADLLNVTVRRPKILETTALGAAYLAGLAVGYWESQEALRANWHLDREFTPSASTDTMTAMYERWQKAVERSRDWLESEDSGAGT